MIEKFEGKLENARLELDLLSTGLESNSKEIGLERNNFFFKELENKENSSTAGIFGANSKVNADSEIPDLGKKMINQNKFTASRRGEMLKKPPKNIDEEISQEIEDLFLRAETQHGIARTTFELKRAASKILKGDVLLFLKANLMSNYHLLYDVLNYTKKKVAVLFLHPPMAKVLRKIIPKEIGFLTLNSLQQLPKVDVLFIENCELFEDLSYVDLIKMKYCLQRAKCTKVLVSNLMTYRAFCLMRDQIGVPFSGIALPGLKIENLSITSSKDQNKSLALKKFLVDTSKMLMPEDKILILTNTQSEANELYKFLSQGGELSHYVRIKNIHFGPISNPPLNTIFSVVIYFSIPKKLEKFYCHVSMLYNNYYYRNYGKLTALPKLHFHVFISEEDYAFHRHKIFMKNVTRLQVNRLLKTLDDIYKEFTRSFEGENNSVKEFSRKLNINKVGKICDMENSAVVRTLRQCQADKLIAVNQPYPTAFNVRLLSSSKDKENHVLKKVLEGAKKSSGVYKVIFHFF